MNGGMAEWTKAAVLKTADPKGSGGSNPSPAASGVSWFREMWDSEGGCKIGGHPLWVKLFGGGGP